MNIRHIHDIDQALLDQLSAQAKANPRLRQAYDLRNSADDNSQRILNALEPSTVVPIHRHTQSTETVTLLRGSVRLLFFDEQGRQTSASIVEACSSCPFYFVPQGAWHTVECLSSGTIIFEAQDGAYQPMAVEDVMERAK